MPPDCFWGKHMEKDNKTANKIVQTYAEDMAKVIEDDQSGLIKKIIREEEGHDKEKKNMSPQSKKNRFFMIASVLFMSISLATLLFFLLRKENSTVPIEQQFTPLIFNDQSTFLEISGLSKDEISQTVLNAINANSVKNGGVQGIYLTENKVPIGLRRFISLIKGNFVPGDNTDFVSDKFLIGAIDNDTKDFFIILKVRTIADIFDSLRAWENKMFFDLHGFFGYDITPESKYLLTANFEDGIVENKNARFLYTKDAQNNKKVSIMYVLADDNSVVITNTEKAVHEIMLRLAASRIKK